MPASVSLPQRQQKESTLDKILKGIAIANQGLGAAASFQNIRSGMTEKDLNEEKLKAAQRSNTGALTTAEFLKEGIQVMPSSVLSQGPAGADARSPLAQAADLVSADGSPLARGPLGPLMPRGAADIQFTDAEGKVQSGRGVRTEDIEKLANRVQKYQDDFAKDIKKPKDQLLAAVNARQLLGGGPISQEAVKTQIARLTGEVGNLTENDVARFGGSSALSEKIDQYFTKLADGTLTPANRAELANIIETFENNARGQINELGSAYATQMMQTTGIPVEEATERLAVSAFANLNKEKKGGGGKKDESKKNSGDSKKPKTVIQNGHTYTLNPETGEYE